MFQGNHAFIAFGFELEHNVNVVTCWTAADKAPIYTNCLSMLSDGVRSCQ